MYARVYMDSHLVVLLSTLRTLQHTLLQFNWCQVFSPIPSLSAPYPAGSSSLVFPSDASWAVSLIMDRWVPTTKQGSAPPGGLKGWKWNPWSQRSKEWMSGKNRQTEFVCQKLFAKSVFEAEPEKKKLINEWWWCYIFNITHPLTQDAIITSMTITFAKIAESSGSNEYSPRTERWPLNGVIGTQ